MGMVSFDSLYSDDFDKYTFGWNTNCISNKTIKEIICLDKIL